MAEDQNDQAVATEDRPELNVTVEDAGPALKKLTIEVPESRIKEKIEEQFDSLKRDAVIPGFRRGRAPHRLIERRFGEALRGDVKGQLLSETYTQACEDNGLDVLGEPDVKDADDIELPESGPMTFVVEVEVTPEVELPDFASIKVDKVKAEVTDDDVTAEIDNYRERMGSMEAAEDGAKVGDFCEGPIKVLAGEDAGDDAEVLVDQPQTYALINGEDKEYKGHLVGIVVDDLGKRLAGKEAGHTERISMTGPKGHENEKVRDQPITIEFTISQIQRVKPAEIEALVQQMGVEDEAALREQMKQMLESRAQQQQQADMYDQVREQLVAAVEMELPEGLTSRQVERSLQQQRMELMYRGTSPEDVEQQIAEARENSEAESIKQIKQFFILDKASKDLEVEVNENEINMRVAQMAFQQQRRPEKMRAEMRERGELEQLYLQIREQKTLDQIIEKATVTEVDAPAEEKKPAAKKKSTKKKSMKKKSTKKKPESDEG